MRYLTISLHGIEVTVAIMTRRADHGDTRPLGLDRVRVVAEKWSSCRDSAPRRLRAARAPPRDGCLKPTGLGHDDGVLLRGEQVDRFGVAVRHGVVLVAVRSRSQRRRSAGLPPTRRAMSPMSTAAAGRQRMHDGDAEFLTEAGLVVEERMPRPARYSRRRTLSWPPCRRQGLGGIRATCGGRRWSVTTRCVALGP